MPKELDTILSYAAKLWQRCWLVLITAILVCAIGWPVVFLLPDKYQVTAKVYLDTQTILKPLLKGPAVDSTTIEQTV